MHAGGISRRDSRLQAAYEEQPLLRPLLLLPARERILCAMAQLCRLGNAHRVVELGCSACSGVLRLWRGWRPHFSNRTGVEQRLQEWP